MRNLLTCFLLVFSANAPRLVAQETDTLHVTIEEVFARIDTAFPKLAYYDAANNSLEAQSAAVRSWMPPTISVSLDRFPYQPSMLEVTGPENQAGIMISAQQMIPNPAKLDARQAAVEARYNINSSNAAWTKNQLHADAKIYYYRRCVAEKKLVLLSQNRSTLQLLIVTAQSGYKYNQNELAGIYRAKAQLASISNMELMLQSEIAECTIGLNTLMNRTPLAPLVLDTTVTMKNYAYYATNDTAIAARSDIAAMNYTIQAMRAEQNSMSSERKPDFGIAISHSQMFGMENQYSVMGMMTIPIAPWSSGMYTSRVKSMDFEIIAMQKETETMQLMAQQMATEKLIMFSYEQKLYTNYRDSVVPAFRAGYDAALIAYGQGTGSFFVVLDSWEMLLMKQLEMLDVLNAALQLQTEYEYEIESR